MVTAMKRSYPPPSPGDKFLLKWTLVLFGYTPEQADTRLKELCDA